MPRITIDVSSETYRALREAADQKRRSVEGIIAERVEVLGRELVRVEELHARADEGAILSEEENMELAVRVVRLHREGL